MRKIILLFIVIPALAFSQSPRIVSNIIHHGPLFGGGIYRADVPATTPGLIHSFNNLNPHMARTGVIPGNEDWLYGMLNFNGTNTNGCLYRVRKDGTGFTVINNLDNFPGAQTTPYYHTDGNIYFNDEFALKKLDPTTDIVTSYNYNNGVFARNFLIDDDDWVYFTTEVFSLAKMRTNGADWTVLHNFSQLTDGNAGFAGVIEIPGDTLFGVNSQGGVNDLGTIYSIKKDGSGFTVHHHFDGTDGSAPESRLVYFDGKLYGTTLNGGDNSIGTIYTINPDGSGFRVLYHFIPSTGGANPFGEIHINNDGRIFGTFYQFASQSFTSYRMYKVDTSGANFELFYPVNQREAGHGHMNFHYLNGDSILVTTQTMGRHDGGALSTTDTVGNSSQIFHFGMSTNGFNPLPLIKGSDGKLYGMNLIGGATGNGVIYSINDDGTGFTKLHEFSDAEGYEPNGKLLEASDGKLYGVLRWGGPTNQGSFFRIDKNGANFEITHSLNNTDDAYNPNGSLAEDNLGVLYGASFESLNGSGTVFRINKNGTGFTLLQSFNIFTGIGNPLVGVVLHNDYLYGAHNSGGAEFKGGIYRVKKDGTDYSVLHEFNGLTDGSSPQGAPMIASNGKLYGITTFGGMNNWGTIFSIDLTGTNYAILRHFDPTTDGGSPVFSFIQATDGLLYGSTFASSFAGGAGTIYSMDLNGNNFTVVKVFDLVLEGQASSGLVDLGAGTALPVQWLSFTGNKKNQTVVLTWKTAQEVNTDIFEIDRSADGVHFQKIGTIAAAGNTNNISSYEFTDVQPFDGSNYYRLKQVDRDRTFEYSRIIKVNFGKYQNNFLYPNPATEFVNLRLSSGHGFNSLKIFDASGRLVMQKALDGNQNSYTINIAVLPNGLYNVILSGLEEDHQSFIKK